MTITLNKIQGLIAGNGELPVCLAKSAQRSGFDVIAVSLSPSNRKQLEKYCSKVYSYGAGELQKIVATLHAENVKQLTFIGKVSKGMLFRNPRLDKRALKLIQNLKRLNDDGIMLSFINELDKENIEVLDQTIFIKDVLVTRGVLGNIQPTSTQTEDINYGFELAKEMGRLDIGQTVVVQNKMVLAVEAIEGTDKAIERGCKLGSVGSVVVKVSKPKQDKRFDIPTVGMNTLRTMYRYGARVLAVEADETFIVEKSRMIKFADSRNIVVVAV